MANFADRAARWRVPLHFLLAVVVLVFAHPRPRLMTVSAVLVAAGLAIRAWAAGYLQRAGPGTLTGPYAHLRHPLYFGSAFILAGFAMGSGRFWLAALMGLFFAGVYVPVMRREERERRAEAPERYAAFAARVPAFFPRLRPAAFLEYAEEKAVGFRFEVYRSNREWRALAGCAALWFLLYAKMVWGG